MGVAHGANLGLGVDFINAASAFISRLVLALRGNRLSAKGESIHTDVIGLQLAKILISDVHGVCSLRAEGYGGGHYALKRHPPEWSLFPLRRH